MIEGNPGRRALNPREAKPELELPSPPPFLNADAKEEWVRVSAELYGLGLLTGIDRGPLAAYCQAYGRWTQAERAILEMQKNGKLGAGLMIMTSNGNAIQNPLVGTANKAMRDMIHCAAEFGMTPSARSRVDAGHKPAAGKFDGLLG